MTDTCTARYTWRTTDTFESPTTDHLAGSLAGMWGSEPPVWQAAHRQVDSGADVRADLTAPTWTADSDDPTV